MHEIVLLMVDFCRLTDFQSNQFVYRPLLRPFSFEFMVSILINFRFGFTNTCCWTNSEISNVSYLKCHWITMTLTVVYALKLFLLHCAVYNVWKYLPDLTITISTDKNETRVVAFNTTLSHREWIIQNVNAIQLARQRESYRKYGTSEEATKSSEKKTQRKTTYSWHYCQQSILVALWCIPWARCVMTFAFAFTHTIL